jgi:hypothetical protein
MDLPELKAVYDELWVDAKALAKDMKMSIEITRYAAYATLLIIFTSIMSSLPHFYNVVTGNFTALSVFTVFFVIIGSIVISLFIRRLIRLHHKLKEKYSKLIDLEPKME